MRKTMFGLLMLVLVFAVACAKPPQDKIDAARQAIGNAEAVGAADYAPDSLRAATDMQSQLDSELKAQEEKFALFRSYKKASELCAQVQQAGEKAVEDAKTRKEQVKQEAQALVEECKTLLGEADALLKQAPRGKGSQADIEMMKADLAGAQSSLAEAESAWTAERYLDAQSKAEAVKNTIMNVKTSIEQAIEAKKGHRK